MINRIWMSVCLFALFACVMKPPVQEMAEARSAVEMAQKMSTSDGTANGASQLYLKRAKTALQQASQAIKQKKYDKARMQALEARRQAQKSARLSQKKHP